MASNAPSGAVGIPTSNAPSAAVAPPTFKILDQIDGQFGNAPVLESSAEATSLNGSTKPCRTQQLSRSPIKLRFTSHKSKTNQCIDLHADSRQPIQGSDDNKRLRRSRIDVRRNVEQLNSDVPLLPYARSFFISSTVSRCCFLLRKLIGSGKSIFDCLKMDIVSFGIELLGSNSSDEQLIGARILRQFSVN
ncbi:unnamed protein product [Microthlaspi erraticum]|uniref:Uncharacterized protein n=1 Tax=Microthlaspi erraticum TaxID=1685480 RepID=A0A6D2JSP7_9BRAS|nr:unnamed protein product [Microthlaspi erraticum]